MSFLTDSQDVLAPFYDLRSFSVTRIICMQETAQKISRISLLIDSPGFLTLSQAIAIKLLGTQTICLQGTS